MSDQTPNSTEDLAGGEPSMEDILASIRKIISEDEPVALESPEDTGLADIVTSEFGNAPNNPVSDAVADNQFADLESHSAVGLGAAGLGAAGLAGAVVAEADTGSVDLNIDDVLAGLDEDLAADLDVPDLDVSDLAVSNDIESDDDILAFLDKDIALDDEAGVELDAVEDFVLPSSEIDDVLDLGELEASVTAEDADMDAVLDDLLMTSDDDLTDDLPLSEEESDLQLVKSLMADLADDPDGLETDEDLDALLEIPDMDAPADLASAEDDDIVGDILDMTLEDELAAQPDDIDLEDFADFDDISAAEAENIIENAADFETPELETADFDPLDFATADAEIAELGTELDSLDMSDAAPSLSDIAAAAEADAVAVETNAFMPSMAAGAGAAGLAAFGLNAANAGDEDEAPSGDLQVEEVTDDIDDKIDTFIDKISAEPSADEYSAEDPALETTTQSLSNQETSMPVKAVKKDAIIDEVTETATAGAFAELNQVVEDKAVFSESGPRIGDLVQDALRPMLKEWLDANLKGIVERAVTKEVKRISSGK